MKSSPDSLQNPDPPTAAGRPRLFVSNSSDSVRMFRRDWMEALSKVHWSVPLMVYLPVVIGLLYYGVAVQQAGLPTIAAWFIAGAFAWTPLEYVLHRFVFHYHPTSAWGRSLHFVMHGVHHDYPSDARRLVMPPTASIPIVLMIYGVVRLVVPGHALLFMSGLLSGYMAYDMIHYALHHASFRSGWLRTLKQHHMRHHYSDPNHGFGVSTRMWDDILGTRFSTPRPVRPDGGEAA